LGIEFGLAIVKLSLQPQFQTVKKTSWFLFSLIFAFSCLDDPDCFLLNNDVIGISFQVLGSSTPDSLHISSLSINGIQVDSVYADGDVRATADLSMTKMSVLATRSTDTLRLDFLSNGVVKTIRLSYDWKVQFVSEECGARYIFSDLFLEGHNFDRIDLLSTSPGRDASSVNLVVYRCPKADTMGLSFLQLTLPATGAASSRSMSASLNSITVNGTTQLYIGKTVSTLKLPVNIEDTKSNYVFDFADDFGYAENVRSLSVAYDVDSEVRFEACGVQKFVNSLRIETASGIEFDQVSLATESDGDFRDALTDPETNNINIYRCPPTNIIQVAFANSLGSGTSKKIIGVTNNYNSDLLYADTTLNRIQLPLNPASESTTFNIQFEGSTETIVLNHSWTAPRPGLFTEGSSCNLRSVVTNLSEGVDNPRATVESAAVVYPAITNVTLEVAD
jgi:hypothetical protein